LLNAALAVPRIITESSGSGGVAEGAGVAAVDAAGGDADRRRRI